jgi:dynein intermediate chain
MSDKRRAEIEAKRAKLAEIRKARAERQKEIDRRPEVRETVIQVDPNKPRAEYNFYFSKIVGPSPRKGDVSDLVDSLLGGLRRRGPDSIGDLTPSPSIPGTPAFGHPASLSGVSAMGMPPRTSSRQSDLTSDRGTNAGQMSSGTDHLMER